MVKIKKNLKDTFNKTTKFLSLSSQEREKRIQDVAQKKGIKVGNSYDFTTHMVENAIDAYIMQYGLRKVMN